MSNTAVPEAPLVKGGMRIIREHERKRRTGVSRAHWYKLEQQGRAPKRVKLGDAAHGWFEGELADWLEQLNSSRQLPPAKAASS